MATSPTFFVLIAFMILFLLFAAVVVLMRKAKYGSVLYSFAQTMLGGTPIIDKAGKGELCELIGYDVNPHTQLIALKLNQPDRGTSMQTPYIFQAEDFNVNPNFEPWEHHNGAIICFWDFERKNNFADAMTKNLQHQVQVYRQHTGILQRTSKAIAETIERKSVPEASVASDIAMAKGMKTIKEIVSETNVENVNNGGADPSDDMFEN